MYHSGRSKEAEIIFELSRRVFSRLLSHNCRHIETVWRSWAQRYTIFMFPKINSPQFPYSILCLLFFPPLFSLFLCLSPFLFFYITFSIWLVEPFLVSPPHNVSIFYYFFSLKVFLYLCFVSLLFLLITCYFLSLNHYFSVIPLSLEIFQGDKFLFLSSSNVLTDSVSI